MGLAGLAKRRRVVSSALTSAHAEVIKVPGEKKPSVLWSQLALTQKPEQRRILLSWGIWVLPRIPRQKR